jgi:hypothetical protein
MKRIDRLFDFFEKLLDFLDRHPVRGKIAVSITFAFLGCVTLLLALKFCAPELVTIIEAFK